ncbi:alpha-galactosidase [Aureococcus anophagefferens]|nr:alpha-galactosidase [Aureococcus anophagefferens]
MHVPRLLCLVAVARGEFDTPMLGFNTCNVGCGNATFPNAAWLLRAGVLVASGFAAGYTSVNLDEGWADLARDGDGNQVANEDRPGGVRPVKDDGCGSCHDYDAADWALESYRRMQAALRGAAAAAGREKPVFFSTESADVARIQYDIASGLARLAHNDSGRGGFFLDCDMLQVGQGEFGNDRVEEIRSHVTMHAMLKSTLLVTRSARPRRAASEPPARPRAVFGNASDYALFAVMPCEPGNPRQRWALSGDGTLATTDEAGAAWCVGAGQWARPAEVLPCGKAPDAGACGCDVYEGCCHDVSVRDGASARVPRRLRDAGDVRDAAGRRSSGPYPRGRYVGANPMGNDVDGADVVPATASGTGAPAGPSSRRRAWAARDGGAILDDDHVGTVRATPAADYCAEAVLSSGNLETWVAPLARGARRRAPQPVARGRAHGDVARSASGARAVRRLGGPRAWRLPRVAATVPGKGVALLVLAPRH